MHTANTGLFNKNNYTYYYLILQIMKDFLLLRRLSEDDLKAIKNKLQNMLQKVADKENILEADEVYKLIIIGWQETKC